MGDLETSDRTPEAPIEQMLSAIRQALEMDVAFVSEFAEERMIFRAVDGDGESFGWRSGDDFSLEETYCKRVLDGRIANVVPDARNQDATRDLWVTSAADIGSYCAVPLVLSNGQPYGTLCCVSHSPDPWLAERDLRLMGDVAREVVQRLESGGRL